MNLFSSFIDNIEQEMNGHNMDVVSDKQKKKLCQILNNILGDREDNASMERDASDAGFVLLEEFPCTAFKRSLTSVGSFNNLDDSNVNSMNVDRRNISRVKHAIINSDQLELFKRCTRPDLSTSTCLVRERALDIENLEKGIRWASPMHTLKV